MRYERANGHHGGNIDSSEDIREQLIEDGRAVEAGFAKHRSGEPAPGLHERLRSMERTAQEAADAQPATTHNSWQDVANAAQSLATTASSLDRDEFDAYPETRLTKELGDLAGALEDLAKTDI